MPGMGLGSRSEETVAGRSGISTREAGLLRISKSLSMEGITIVMPYIFSLLANKTKNFSLLTLQRLSASAQSW